MYSGIIFNVVCNLIFVASSYLMHYYLGYSMSAAEYGIIGTIITILDLEYMFLNNGVRQSISKELSKKTYNIFDLLFKASIFQVVFIVLFFSINFFGAGVFADVLGDNNLSYYLKIAALIIPVNGLYVLTLGINDGFHHFKSSAIIGIVYSIFKLSVIALISFVFSDAIIGTEIGFFVANIVAFTVGVIIIFIHRKDLLVKYTKKIQWGYYIKNTLNFSLFFIIVSVVLSIDTLIVKATATDSAVAGYYTGAVNFGKVSYFVLSAFFTILLPIITNYYSKGNIEEVINTIKNMFVIILSFVLPITCIVSASSSSILNSFYDKEYIYADNTLMLLAFSHFFMGIVVVFNMIISATDRRKFSSVLAIVMVISDVSLCIIMQKYLGILGVALAGLICTLIALVVSGKYMTNIFSNVIENKHIKIICLNILLWIIVKIGFSIFLINNIIVLGIIYVVMYILFIVLLQIFKLINIKKIIGDIIKK